MNAAIGSDNANTKPFQFEPYALPGTPMKVLLLRYVPKTDKPTTQPGSERLATVNPSTVPLPLRK